MSSIALLDASQDDTADLDYTRAITHEFKHARPRRRPVLSRKETRDAPITIFEDVAEEPELAVEQKRNIAGSTLLGKGAKKLPRHGMITKPQASAIEEEPAQHEPRSRHDVSSLADSIPGLRFKTSEPTKDSPPKSGVSYGGLKKEPRRRTIFVPSDDTTMLTIHPGAPTSVRLDDTFQLPSLPSPRSKSTAEGPITARDPSAAPARRPRPSLANAPKRMPLQQTAAKGNNLPAFDVAGRNGGKENSPPHRAVKLSEKKSTSAVGVAAPNPSIASSTLWAPTAASQARQTVHTRKVVPSARLASVVSRPESRTAQPVIKGYTGLDTRSSAKPSQRVSPPQKAKTEPFAHRPRSTAIQSARLQKYPILSEDVAQPDLYESSWLGHQEIALTEVINQILCHGEEPRRSVSEKNGVLRARTVEMYHQPQVSQLHQRVQASLLYGGMSRPKDVPGPMPAHDIGLRKRFLGFWLDNYNQEELATAAEVVVGRQMPQSPPSSGDRLQSTEAILDPHKRRRALIGFLETFMVQIDDVERPDGHAADLDSRWRKLVSRSLMLIWLLDKVKTSEVTSGCLFKRTSNRKSSAQMVQSLANMVIPSVGDIARTLRHLDYEVAYVQDPLDEVTYHIDNMATDLRDGVLLSRLVDLLLFSPQNMQVKDIKEDATITIHMPDASYLEGPVCDVDGARCPRMISRHLKMPCLGRAQKIYNVQLALSALQEHGRLGDGVLDVTAEDIVNGHREKTLSLLWSLVATYGLDALIDFTELGNDIARHRTGTISHNLREDNGRYLTQLEQEDLLQEWSAVRCAKQGIVITNLTTSFANSRAYAAILDAFTSFTAGSCKPTSFGEIYIEDCLRAFGCSYAFIKNLTSTIEVIPTRQTTISNLAFLASRLLPLARRHNAAVTIQRAFRAKRSITVALQRIALMRTAHACARVVQTQNRLVHAATVLQRAWKAVLHARTSRLNMDVLVFQAMARGWSQRRHIRSISHREVSNNSSVRVMGGW